MSDLSVKISEPSQFKVSEPSQVKDAHSSSTDNPIRVRPPISFASPSAFARSVYARFISLWTPSFVRSILYGQILSLVLTGITVQTTELVMRNWILPSTQVIFPYVCLFIVYTPYTIYRYGFKGWGKLILYDGWKYFLLTLIDVEGGFLYIKVANEYSIHVDLADSGQAFGYTDLMSCMLLDAWTIPVCMFVCWIVMRVRYHWSQILGVVICIGGLALLVTSDLRTGKNGEATRKGEGDGFMVAAATLLGIVNAISEFFVLGQIGLWGILISTTQASIVEHKKWKLATWDGTTGAFTSYTFQMMLFRLASSPYFNMSLLTSDFYGLLFGLFLFHYKPYWLYFVAFVIVIFGLIVYFWKATPEEQGITDIKYPKYINVRGGGGNFESGGSTEKDVA
ncbi:hypothetical protein SCLCIDRAFT_19506 [Scleroderma citrinum Foug A]|uniref:DUF914-domain-containing protein n=1 Tax=Scleroderma citrinum Foug A TaxID=1036808 RepID=A0A0C3EAG2_9AGAM|nr:hypothetical protein SCLCIDRAFT_19506 [Scleroderma citrinum Foug A]